MINSSKSKILENFCVLVSDDETNTGIFCGELAVRSSEFYSANQQGIMPQKVLLIHSDEYDYQEKCVYEDVQYIVYRTYKRADGFTEIYLTQRLG